MVRLITQDNTNLSKPHSFHNKPHTGWLKHHMTQSFPSLYLGTPLPAALTSTLTLTSSPKARLPPQPGFGRNSAPNPAACQRQTSSEVFLHPTQASACSAPVPPHSWSITCNRNMCNRLTTCPHRRFRQVQRAMQWFVWVRAQRSKRHKDT